MFGISIFIVGIIVFFLGSFLEEFEMSARNRFAMALTENYAELWDKIKLSKQSYSLEFILRQHNITVLSDGSIQSALGYWYKRRMINLIGYCVFTFLLFILSWYFLYGLIMVDSYLVAILAGLFGIGISSRAVYLIIVLHKLAASLKRTS
jgi:hypothetical protein